MKGKQPAYFKYVIIAQILIVFSLSAAILFFLINGEGGRNLFSDHEGEFEKVATGIRRELLHRARTSVRGPGNVQGWQRTSKEEVYEVRNFSSEIDATRNDHGHFRAAIRYRERFLAIYHYYRAPSQVRPDDMTVLASQFRTVERAFEFQDGSWKELKDEQTTEWEESAPYTGTLPPDFTLVRLAATATPLSTLLGAELHFARSHRRRPLLFLHDKSKPESALVADSLGHEQMVSALRGTYVIQVEINAWKKQLAEGSYRTGDAPVFWELNEKGVPTREVQIASAKPQKAA